MKCVCWGTNIIFIVNTMVYSHYFLVKYNVTFNTRFEKFNLYLKSEKKFQFSIFWYVFIIIVACCDRSAINISSEKSS